MLRRGELLGPWDRCRTHPRASPDTFARRPSWRPMFDDQSSGRRGQRSAHGPRARGGCGVCLARRRGRVNSRRSSRSADLERRAGPPPGPAGATAHGRGQKSFEGLDYIPLFSLCSLLMKSEGRPTGSRLPSVRSGSHLPQTRRWAQPPALTHNARGRAPVRRPYLTHHPRYLGHHPRSRSLASGDVARSLEARC